MWEGEISHVVYTRIALPAVRCRATRKTDVPKKQKKRQESEIGGKAEENGRKALQWLAMLLLLRWYVLSVSV